MEQRQTVAQKDQGRIRQNVRGQLDLLQQDLRQAKLANGLEPDEDLVSQDELEPSPVDYLPHEWKAPEGTPEAPYVRPPWEAWVEDVVESETPTILDWVTQVREVRAWWNPHLEFHRLVASKLIVMEWLKDPQAVTIETAYWRQLDRAGQFDQLLRLDKVVTEVREFQRDPRAETLIDSLQTFAKRTNWTQFLQALEEHRQQI